MADTRAYFVADCVIGDLLARVKGFQRDEIRAITEGDPVGAREARLKAAVLEEVARSYEQPHFGVLVREAAESLDVDYGSQARIFGRRAIEQMRTGRDPFEAARLAGSYAFRVRPDLRDETEVQ